MSESSLSEDGILAIEDVTGSSPTAMRSKVVMLAIEGDLSLFTDPSHDCSSTVRRECWWDEPVVPVER